MADLGKNLQRQRKQRGFTQKQVEEALRLRRGTVYDFEKGRLKPGLDVALRLAELYGCSLDELAGRTGPGRGDEHPGMAPLLQLGILSDRSSRLTEKIRSDPIIVAGIGLDRIHSGRPVLDLLVEDLTPVQRRSYIIELYRYINSLIGRDRRITAEELAVRDAFLSRSRIELTEAEQNSIRRAYNKVWLGKTVKKSFPREALKHFLVWILYLVADADREPGQDETRYIEQVAEHIGLKKSAWLFIHNQVERPPEAVF